MDKEQARFILRSFRPDGADAGDPDFAEALKLAVENRELGEWLASERAFDSAFANALGSVDLPETLREELMACLAAERGDFPMAETANDLEWIGALASIQPPAGLRDEVIAAMDRTVAGNGGWNLSIFRKLAVPLAAAAGIVMAFLATRPAPPAAVVESGRVPIEVVQAGFVRTFQSPAFHLEEKRGDQGELMGHLKEKGLPCPDCPPCPGCMPRGLLEMQGVGCRELVIDGKHGSLVCFKTDHDGMVHMVIFRRDDVSGDFRGMKDPVFVQDGDWASARWEMDGNVFMVISHTPVEKLTGLF